MTMAHDFTAPPRTEDLQLAEVEQLTRRRRTLEQVKRVLEQDPRSPDALRLDILLSPAPPREKASLLKTLITQLEAERVQGAPYLRSLLSLGRVLEQCGKARDAVPLYGKVLQFAPEDPLGVRYHLARCLLDLRRLKDLKELREGFPEDTSALMAWVHLLEVQKSEKQTDLEKALANARRANSFVEDFLTSKRRFPKHHDVPAKPLPGTLEEALHILDMIGEAWFSDRAALSWIIKQ
ncbi:MAG: hypothetical protein H6Q00_1502 [Holophagaceae bacterium]|nr:hypothetical protein [Holophagaceae bacterium]